jgi:aconitate hydratase
MTHPDTFGARSTLTAGGAGHEIFRLDALQSRFDVARLPYTLRILLENLLRREDGETVTAGDVEAVATWDASAEPSREITFAPARVLLQDFTGVPAVVDLAAMRDAMEALGGDPSAIDPLIPAELVIDHSVQVDDFASRLAIQRNAELEFHRNRERYAFLRWGQGAFDALKVVPPNTGICHQVNLEFLARVVEARGGQAFPDTLVGTDSHTTMVNGLGVLGWGVGGIEAEAAMLGESISMLLPQVVGFRLHGQLPEGATATDLVLTVTEILRKTGVVGKFVEYFGEGLAGLPLADRATIGNMSPEYGATCGFFPVDDETLRYLRLTGRSDERLALVEAYCKENMLWHDPSEPATYTQVVELDLSTVEPSLAGPRRPQDRIPLTRAKESFLGALETFGVAYGDGVDEAVVESFPASDSPAHADPGAAEPSTGQGVSPAPVALAPTWTAGVPCELDGEVVHLAHGAVVIAAITSCTNTSNPSVMVAAGLLAKKAVELGIDRRPWVKSSLAPGSKVVTEYFDRAGLTPYLEALGFHTVGYGCTTCIGNSGPLPEPVSKAIAEGDLVACAVLSGNRNFEARIHPEIKANYLASPPLVVAYALAGRMDLDLTSEPLGHTANGEPVFLSDVWPSPQEVRETVEGAIGREMFERTYADVYTGDPAWRELPVPEGSVFAWDAASTYVRQPPYFEGMTAEPATVDDIHDARCLVSLGDSVTTDHISPAGSIKPESPAGRYLVEHGVERKEFNSYGSRRGNHEVMVRGTFANVRLRNLLVPESEGTWTVHLPSGEETTIFEAAERYIGEGVPTIVLAGKEYGSGSSRDWAAKGPNLLGVKAVIAESYERIHRSNLLMMGVLPLQYLPGESRESLGLTGREVFSVTGVSGGEAREVTVRADEREFRAILRLDTPREREYVRHGGILPYVLRKLAAGG